MKKVLGSLVLAAAVTACVDTVAPSVPASIDIVQAQVTLDAVRGVSGLTVVVRDAGGNEMTTPQLSWVSRNTTVATVDEVGAVEARGDGSTWVVASHTAGMRDSVQVHVHARVVFTATLKEMQNRLLNEAAAQADVNVVVHREGQ